MNHKQLLNLFKRYIGFSSTDIPHQHNVVTILPLELLKIVKLVKYIILDKYGLLLAPGLFIRFLFVFCFVFIFVFGPTRHLNYSHAG